MGERAHAAEDFSDAFEAAFARFQIRVEAACSRELDWSIGIGTAIHAALEFAAEDPAAANTLTNEAMAAGLDGIARRERLLSYIGDAFRRGREEVVGELPGMTEHALAGGLMALVGDRVARGRAAELPELAPEAIRFALTPYLGIAETERIASVIH